MTIAEAREVLKDLHPSANYGDVILRDYGFALVNGDRLDFIYVQPEHRGGGLGAELIRFAEQLVGRPLRLQCIVALVPYYERFGFRTQCTAEDGAYHLMQQFPK